MSIMSMLIRLAFKVLESVLKQLMQQFQTVIEQAMNPLKAIVQQVVGGVWKGAGADAFVEELSSLAIPGIGQVGETITRLHGNLNQARDIIQQADQKISQMVQSQLSGPFKFY